MLFITEHRVFLELITYIGPNEFKFTNLSYILSGLSYTKYPISCTLFHLGYSKILKIQTY